MAPAANLVTVVLPVICAFATRVPLTTGAARNPIRSLDVNTSLSQLVDDRRDLKNDLKSRSHIVQVVAKGFSPSRLPVSVNSSVDLELTTAAWKKSTFSFANTPMSQALSVIPVVVLVTILFFVLVQSRNSKSDDDQPRKGSTASNRSPEIKTEFLLKRLSQTVRMLRQDKTSQLQLTEWTERPIGVWWATHSHTWASTRLGWWECQSDHVKRCQPLSSIFLKNVSEVNLVSSANNNGEPGVRIIIEGETHDLLLNFATDELATQYVEDLRLMVKRVKRADKAEGGSLPAEKASNGAEC